MAHYSTLKYQLPKRSEALQSMFGLLMCTLPLEMVTGKRHSLAADYTSFPLNDCTICTVENLQGLSEHISITFSFC